MISIIIPVYNGSKYIRRCLDSVVSQDFSDCETIVIDDGSTDDTKLILQEYVKKYANIKAIYKINEGVSVARNDGLKAAEGDLVIFLDCDDYLVQNALRTISENIDDGKDLYIYNCFMKNGNDIDECVNSPSFPSLNTLILDVIEPLSNKENEWLKTVWAKVYRKSLLEELCFPTDIHIGEDACFMANTIFHLGDINKIKIIPEAWYIYDRTNESSATHKYRNDLYSSTKNQFAYLLNIVNKLGDDKYKRTVLLKYCYKTFWILYYQGQYSAGNEDCFRWYEDTKKYINVSDCYPIEFDDELMRKTFRFRFLLSVGFIRNLIKRRYRNSKVKHNV